MRRTVAAVVVAVLPVMSLVAEEPQRRGQTRHETLARFLAASEHLQSYRAIRRLSASTRGGRMEASLVADTELLPSGEFRYTVLEEHGSDLIRKRVLRAALEGERDARVSGEADRSGLVPANYTFAPQAGDTAGELVRVDLRPLRRHTMLLQGAMFLHPETADLVRVEGQLARRPSIWTRRVEVVRHYGRVAGVRVPLSMESTAQVMMVGASTFAMTYEYASVNGRAVAGLPGMLDASVP
jgi:hypothetical protein